jgi:hypothetical protein
MAGVILGPREDTPERLWHPEWNAGMRYWTDGSVEAVMRKVQHGDPVKGWEGDPRLALYAHDEGEGRVWELCRLEHDGQYRLVARSQPGVPFDDRIVDELIARDRRRGFDVDQAVVAANERRDREAADRAADLDAETGDRLAHALRGA